MNVTFGKSEFVGTPIVFGGNASSEATRADSEGKGSCFSGRLREVRLLLLLSAPRKGGGCSSGVREECESHL